MVFKGIEINGILCYYLFPKGGIVYHLISESRNLGLQKGGRTMRVKVTTALTYLAKAAAILAVVAEAGKKVVSITED